MRILYVVPYVPSLIRTRPYNLIRHLSARGHDLTVLTLSTHPREREQIEALRSDCADLHAVYLPRGRSMVNCLMALPTSVPLQAVYSWSPAFDRKLAALRSEADVVHVEHLRGVRYALHALRGADETQPPVVWDSVDCISYLFEQAAQGSRSPFGRLISRLELPRTRRYEGWAVQQFRRVLVSSAVDKGVLEQLSRRVTGGGNGRPDGASLQAPRITVLPNGVDVKYFSPGQEPRDPQTIVFSGKMSYHANITAALYLVEEVMPLIWAERPDVKLIIVGKDPPQSVRALAEAHAPRIEVTGTVPDIRPYLRQATLAVVPLVYGAGSQFKVLEAMSCAAPVVCTPQAISALDVQPDQDLLVGRDPFEFAAAALRLLGDPALRQKMSAAGRRFVESKHHWSIIAAQLEETYHGVVNGQS